VNLAEGQINLIDIETSSVIRRFRGQKQGQYVIRSAFGGAEENFVISGSEGAQVGSVGVELYRLLTRARFLHLYLA
jgi:WD repeat-containing protein 26